MSKSNFLPKEVAFAHAVTLAGQFVANGDVRVRSISATSDELTRLSDLIDSLYDVVQGAYAARDA